MAGTTIPEPSFDPDGGRVLEVVETHISWVFLTAERAYKLRKPVVMPFLDYSTPERRRHMAEEEVRLGRRLAPDLYLGVRPVFRTASGLALEVEGKPVDHVVEMRRFDAGQTLAARLAADALDDDVVRALGALLAGFHAAGPACSGWGTEEVARAVGANFEALLAMDAEPEPARRIQAGHRFAVAFLHHRRALLAERSRTSVRDGHGDLRAEHVLLDGDVQIFDPVEFDPALRRIDVSADLAFLVMDLERLGRADLVPLLLSGYRDAGGDPGDDRLVHFYAAYRAWVRAKVAWLRAVQHGHAAADLAEVAELAELGGRLAWRARSPLALVVCGPAASGKTYLARRLASASGLAHVNSDVVRKRLLGVPPEQAAPPSAYGEDWNRRTYAELGRLAAAEVERGGGVIVDATFRSLTDRRTFAAAYGAAPAPLFVECMAPASVLAERAEGRRGEHGQPSDAGAAIALGQLEGFEALEELDGSRHVVLRTDRPAGAVIDELEAIVDERLLPP